MTEPTAGGTTGGGSGSGPTVSIATPTSATTYSTTSSTVSIGGSAWDSVWVAQVQWVNDRGGSGIATGTAQNWSVPSIPLQSGANVITVTVLNRAGNTATDALTVTRATTSSSPDTTPPTVTIATPTSATTYSTTSSTVTIGGSAWDSVWVAQVQWVNDRGGGGIATGTAQNWSVPSIPLQSGANVITVTVLNRAGNTATDTITVTRSTTPDTTTPTGTVALRAEPLYGGSWRAVRLTWSNAPWAAVEMYRNGKEWVRTENDGIYSDTIWTTGTYTYVICQAGSRTNCSNSVSVTF
jgi:hypothetical protein